MGPAAEFSLRAISHLPNVDATDHSFGTLTGGWSSVG
jgi:hypothetical protein